MPAMIIKSMNVVSKIIAAFEIALADFCLNSFLPSLTRFAVVLVSFVRVNKECTGKSAIFGSNERKISSLFGIVLMGRGFSFRFVSPERKKREISREKI